MTDRDTRLQDATDSLFETRSNGLARIPYLTEGYPEPTIPYSYMEPPPKETEETIETHACEAMRAQSDSSWWVNIERTHTTYLSSGEVVDSGWVFLLNREYGERITFCPFCGERLPE